MRFKEFLFLIENNQFQQKKAFFINQGNQEQIVNYYINKFSELRKNYPTTKAWNVDLTNFTIPKNKRTDINQYKTFKELEQIVDYVNGQVKPQNIKVEIDGTPIHKDNHIEVYYAPHKHACIKYGEGYSWCVSRSDSSNMYNTLRYKEDEPSFYFVKNIEKTNKELVNNSNGNWLDKYHMFVIQVMKQGYIVSSASNDGDKRMSWKDIIRIEPYLKNLKHLFVNYALSDKEREDYKKFKPGLTDEQFKKLSYEEKEKYLDIYVSMDNLLTDEQFSSLPDDLKNKYISFGVIMPVSQFELFKSDRKLVNRHYEIMERIIERDIDLFVEYAVKNDREDLFRLIKEENYSELEFNYRLNLAKYYLKKNLEVPNGLIQSIAEVPTDYVTLLILYVEKNKEIPHELIQHDIMGYPKNASNLALHYINKDKEVPHELIQTVSLSLTKSLELAKVYINKGKKVPNELIQTILEDSNVSADLAKVYVNKNKEVPDELMQNILEDPHASFALARFYVIKDKEVSYELMQQVLKDSYTSSMLSQYYLDKNLEVPSVLMQKVLKDSYASSNLTKHYLDKGLEVPGVLKDKLNMN